MEEGAGLDVEIESAGTHGYHIGAAPDRRAMDAARRRGVDLSLLRARQVVSEDFLRFDLILAMDESNLAILKQRAPVQAHERIRLFLEFGSDIAMREVPDPYYGGERGFEHVLDLAEDAARGLLEHLRHMR